MAEIAFNLVTRLIQMISTQVAKETNLLRSTPENIGYIKEELATMRAFLGVVERMHENTERHAMAKPWAEQVKDLAYDIEDCLEEHIGAHHQHHPCWSHHLLNLTSLHRFATQLTILKSRIGDVSERNMRYHVIIPNQSISNYMAIMIRDGEHGDRDDFREKKEMDSWIGEARCMELALIKEEPKVDAYAGLCGSGTSACIKDIHKERSESNYFDCTALIILSRPVNTIEVFMDMMWQLFKDSSTSSQAGYKVQERELAQCISSQLKEKWFLIIFDGLWMTQDWDQLKSALPDSSRSGSRIIVTTGIIPVAKHCVGHRVIPVFFGGHYCQKGDHFSY